jgi:RNA recognition motif-containing protein
MASLIQRQNNVSSDLNPLKENKQDDPPNSRLFIVCGKSVTEDDFREAFNKFGTIDEIWMVKDRISGEPKGNKLENGGQL